ncbi:hypothetical protein, partial [Meiothermus hypogaeus]
YSLVPIVANAINYTVRLQTSYRSTVLTGSFARTLGTVLLYDDLFRGGSISWLGIKVPGAGAKTGISLT